MSIAPQMIRVTAGFLPLLDASILIASPESGFAEELAIDIALVRETSLAKIRNCMSVGQFGVAHILALVEAIPFRGAMHEY